MKPTVTLQQIANACGVSKATVSMALNGSPRIGVETARLVREVAGRLGYSIEANYAARRMAFARRNRRLPSHVIGVAGPDETMLSAPYFLRITQGLWEVLCHARHAVLAVGHADANWCDFVARDDMDGLIAFGSDPIALRLDSLRAHPGFGDRPVVVLVHRVPGLPCVQTDDASGTYEACRRLLELGHRRFLLVAMDPEDPPRSGHEARRAGMRRAFLDAGLDPRAHIVPHVCPKAWMNPLRARGLLAAGTADPDGERLVTAIRTSPGISALLCDNDPIALHAYASLRQAGLDVPGHISMVGFDDTDALPNVHGENRLASVALPLEEIGREGARLMLRLLAGQATADQRILLPTRFVPRASVGPAPAGLTAD
jgi:LacI family transcriptional regulator